MNKPKIICLTPVKNEAWILNRFLKCTSTWADHIIIADQNSTDGSREIALSFPKVILIENPSPDFNEAERQQLLVLAARKIPGKRILITLDADEILSGNFHNSCEWITILNSPIGTVFQFQWINLLPDMTSCWIPDIKFHWGFVDDGLTLNEDNVIHNTRIPIPDKPTKVCLHDIKVIHYQYTDWKRMLSKHRWYQCLERIHYPTKSSIDIFRQYSHMHAIPSNQKTSLQNKWFFYYENQGIDMTSTHIDSEYWWDKEVIKLITQNSTPKFDNLFIWDYNFRSLLEKRNISLSNSPSLIYWIIKFWLKNTQRHKVTPFIKFVDYLLKIIFYPN